MAVIDLIEPQKHSRLKVGVLAAAMIPSASAPGTLCHDDLFTARLIDIQPSGCEHALKYWGGFTPVSSFEDAAVPTALCGSGGDSVLTKLIDVEETDQEADVGVPLSHNETIAGIRSALSLQIKELAEVLRVQRPTIYSWINNEVEPSAGNRERMQQVYRIAAQWTRRCNLPAERLVRGSGTDGHSVLDLLKADKIDEADIIRRFERLAVERRKMKTEADRKRPTAATVARRHGFKLYEISDQQHLIDAETGKRSNPD